MTETLTVAPGRPGAYDKIGPALAAAPAGAVVTIAPGTYREALYVTDRHIVLAAEEGPGTVVIDVSASEYPAFSSIRSQVELRDLTLKAGQGSMVQAGDHSGMTLVNCTAAGPNGIVVRNGSRATLRGVRFLGTQGPAVLHDADCPVVVEECTTENGGSPVVGQRPGRPPRPGVVTAAVLLMLPTAVVWLVAGIAWMVVTSRMEGDAMFLFWILAVAVLGVCLLVSLMAAAGMRLAWQGRGNILNLPGGFTLALFGIVIVNLLIKGRIEFSETQLTPLIVGALAGVSVGLVNSKAATHWFEACAAHDGVVMRQRVKA